MIGFLVIAHEFGHFIVAKANGVAVIEFAVGFGPRIFHIKKGETEYALRLIPFGGACIMLGDAMMEMGDEENKYDESRALSAKSVWARIAIIVAGPFFNFIIAFIFAVIIIASVGIDPCTVDVVEEGSPAYEAGLQVGDLITSINGDNMAFSKEYSFYTYYHGSETMNITYKRDGVKYTATVTPQYRTSNVYRIGVVVSDNVNITTVTDDSPAKEAGVKVGDIILTVNGQKLSDTLRISDIIAASGGEAVEMVVKRGDKEVTLNVTPAMTEVKEYYTGFDSYGYRVKKNPAATIGYAFKEVGYWIEIVLKSVGMMFTGQVSINDLSGPVGVVDSVNTVVEQSKPEGTWMVCLNLFNYIVMLSANLGVMNLLPLPALDGGKLLFLVIEALRGKPVKAEHEGMVHFIGMVLLMFLMVYIMFKDIAGLF
jgi:regulator of sigma E protease